LLKTNANETKTEISINVILKGIEVLESISGIILPIVPRTKNSIESVAEIGKPLDNTIVAEVPDTVAPTVI
jgi:hypothetical protein